MLPSPQAQTCSPSHTRKNGNLRVPFGMGVHDGRMYGPLEVARGRACNCVCPGCREPLLAKLPVESNRVPHFAHAPGAECALGLETSLHLAAKQIIEQERSHFVPALRATLDIKDALNRVHHREHVFSFEGTQLLAEVRVEQSLDTVRPDLIAVPLAGGQEVAIEIAVTHFVDDEKLEKIARLGLATLEYDLSGCCDLSWESLKNALLDGEVPVRWIYHPLVAERLRKWEAELEPTLAGAQREADEASAAFYAGLEQEREEARAQAALERERKAAAERELRRKRHAELTIATQFKESTEEEKRQRLARSFGRTEVPTILRAKVSGGDSFGVKDPLLWQGVLFRKLIHGAVGKEHPVVLKDYAVSCLGYRFNIQPSFPDAEKIAVWKYLTELAERGALRRKYAQKFVILVASLEAFELLQAYRAGSVTPDKGLSWSSEGQWPDQAVALTLAEAHSGCSDLPTAWRGPATGLPEIAQYSIQDSISRYTSSLYDRYSSLDDKALIEYWISAGFLVAG